ncbi:glycogen/starch synthase [Thermodesulfobacteriota bacterium]
MPNYSTQPRILFVSPEVALIPEGTVYRPNYNGSHIDGFGDFPAELASALFHLCFDVHVAQPDYRRIFAILARNKQTNSGIKLPMERVQLAKDRTFFYSKPIDSNSEWENIKISLAFQREVINQIIPRIQPDLIHCYDWMTGLIPAAAKKNEIPCLFTVQKFDTARCPLSCIEDIGIDAAVFWQNLFYDRYPGSYEQTRDTNPLDLLLSGILAASHVNTTDPLPLPGIAEGQSDFMYSSLGQVLAQKWRAGCACEIPGPLHIGPNPTNNKKLVCSYRPKGCHAGNQGNDRAKRQPFSSSENWTTAKCYIDLYETILRRPLVTPENKVHPINKNSLTKASGARAIAYPKAHSTKSDPLPNQRISTPAMVAI